MKNVETILKEFGIEIPKEKKKISAKNFTKIMLLAWNTKKE